MNSLNLIRQQLQAWMGPHSGAVRALIAPIFIMRWKHWCSAT